VAPVVVNTAQVHGYAGNGVITAADLTLENPLTEFQVGAAASVVIPIDASFIQDLLIAGEAYAGFSLRNVTVPSGVFTFWTVDSWFEQFNPVLELEVDETRVVPESGSIVLVTTAPAAVLAEKGRMRLAFTIGDVCQHLVPNCFLVLPNGFLQPFLSLAATEVAQRRNFARMGALHFIPPPPASCASPA